METTKREFVNHDCGLVATAEQLGGQWFIEVHTNAPLNTIAKESEADVLEWALQHGFKQRRAPGQSPRRRPGQPM
jgi:hypothetical protein